MKTPAWQRKEGKSPSGGLNAKGRASAKAEGMNLKAPVKSGDNPRRASFLARMGNMPGPGGFAQPFQSISEGELSANQRYPVYGRGVGDLEDLNAQQQTWYGNLTRGVVKGVGRAVGTFAQSLTNIPNTISAIKDRDISKLSGDPDGYEGTIDKWIENLDNFIPTYQSAYAKAHPFVVSFLSQKEVLISGVKSFYLT